jgi:hypothetical protein
MAAPPELFLHIGLHKTGSTFLQQAVFPHWPDIDYLGKPYAANHLEGWIHRGTNKALISNEQFSSAPVGAFLVEGPERWNAHRVRCLKRLSILFPEAAIIVGVRSQPGFVLSLYSQYISFGGTLDVEEFWKADGGAAPLAGEDLLLSPAIDLIGSIWPKTFVFSLDELSGARRDLLFADLARFFGVNTRPQVSADHPINESVPQELAEKLLSQSRCAPASMPKDALGALLRKIKEDAKTAGWFSPWKGGTPMRLPPRMREDIETYYAEDWGRLLKLTAQTRSQGNRGYGRDLQH